MNAKAYLLVEVDTGRLDEVRIALRQLPNIRTTDVVTGPYDVIATAEAADQRAIGRMIMDEIHKIPGIKRTITCVAIE
jgi:DNA-binding Lrp family transcriptional regulator